MSDLRTRIAAAIYNACDEYTRKLLVRPDCPGASELEGDGKPACYVLADAVIRELPELTALRRCERCRIPCLPDEYPPMSEGSDELRPFCIPCTNYIEWATS